jgi:hypothetical protein
MPATVAVLIATVVGTGACGDGVTEGGPLRGLPPEQGVGVVNRDAGRFPTWVYGSFAVCLEEDGPVTLEGIEAATVGGVKVLAVGAKQMTSEGVAAMPGPMPSGYSSLEGMPVSEQCSAGQGVELVLELGVPDAGSSGVDGFTIRYSRGDQQYEVGYAAQILLCRGKDTSADAEVLADCADEPDQ